MSRITVSVSRTACVLALAVSASTLCGYDRMIVFGDSLSDGGNLSLALGPGVFPARNYDPLRVTSGPTTTPASAYTGVAVEHLNDLLWLPALTPSVLGGSNYAWAYATTGLTGLDPISNATPGTGTQVAGYLAANPIASADSLYVLWGGANDLFGATTPAEFIAAQEAAMANLQGQISALLNAGARNILWFNLPDLGLTPDARAAGLGAQALLHQISTDFRDDWSASLAQFAVLYPEASVTGVDVYSFMHAVVNNPNAFGFTNVTDSAQGVLGANPDEYLFWDAVHPTARTHRLLAEFVHGQIHPVPEANASVFAAILLLGLIARQLVIRR